jgi:hypothetical protein
MAFSDTVFARSHWKGDNSEMDTIRKLSIEFGLPRNLS